MINYRALWINVDSASLISLNSLNSLISLLLRSSSISFVLSLRRAAPTHT